MAAPFVIGIGGISGGGKTSLSLSLKKNLQSVEIIHMDDYYWPTLAPIITGPNAESFPNWDCLEAVDWDSLIKAVRNLQSSSCPPSVIVIEGIMVLNYRLKFVGREPDWYCEQITWPAYEQCLTEVRKRQSVGIWRKDSVMSRELHHMDAAHHAKEAERKDDRAMHAAEKGHTVRAVHLEEEAHHQKKEAVVHSNHPTATAAAVHPGHPAYGYPPRY